VSYEERITSVVVLPKGEPIFERGATAIRINDEAGGEFIIVEQTREEFSGSVHFDADEWPFVRAAINRMVRRIRKEAQP
jgi:hypothetical protein